MNKNDRETIEQTLAHWEQHAAQYRATSQQRRIVETWAQGLGLVLHRLDETALANRAGRLGQGFVPEVAKDDG